MTLKSAYLVLIAAVLAASAGVFLHRAVLTGSASADTVTELLRLELPDENGKIQKLSQWRGKILVINFWATWCEPCREEVPALVSMQARYASNGVQIVGIAVDSTDKVREFSRTYRINYPLVIGGLEVIDLSRKLGNKAGGLPYTLVLDRSGKVVSSHLGGMSKEELEAMVKGVAI
jgi:thiol-disulfide isomerase/thioredoxin